MELPNVSSEQKQLNKLFAGTWRGEEKIFPSKLEPDGGTAIGTWSVTPSLDGFVLLVDYSEERGGEVRYRGHGVHTWDARERCFFAFWFDNVGMAQKAGSRATLDGNRYTYEWSGESGRARMTYVWDKQFFTFTIERSPDGKTWSPMHEGRYSRDVDIEVSG